MKNELKDGLDFAAITIGIPTAVLIFITVWSYCSNKFALLAASILLSVAMFYLGTVYEYMRNRKKASKQARRN
jgi:hypothetical protein